MVASVKAVHTVSVPPKLGVLRPDDLRVLAGALAKLSAWCQSVPSSPGYLGKNSVRQHSTSGPSTLATRSTISGRRDVLGQEIDVQVAVVVGQIRAPDGVALAGRRPSSCSISLGRSARRLLLHIFSLMQIEPT